MKMIPFEKWNCEICTSRFDTEAILPLLFKHCGHTACSYCITAIITQAKEENKAYINCYKCRSTHTFTERENENFMSFPKNYTLLQLMERNEQKQECEHKNVAKNIICLDNQCLNKAKCCFICYKLRHFNCLSELVLQSDKFSEFIQVETLTTNDLFKSSEIKEVISRKVDQLHLRINSFVDFCEKSIKGESAQLENLTAENYFEKGEAVRSNFNAETGRIILSHKNKEFIDVFAKKLNNLLTGEIWETFRNIENALFAANYSYFLKIKTPVNSEDNELFDKISASSVLLLENFLLPSLDFETYSSHEDYFKKLGDCWKIDALPLKEVRVVHSSSIKKEIEVIAVEVVKKALSASHNILEVENEIAAKFSSHVFYNNASNWKCRLSFREPADLKENECCIIINLKVTGGLFVSIFYPKEMSTPTFSNKRLSLVDLNQHV